MSIDLHLKPNTLYHGDCLDIMRVWAKTHPDGCADLIYLDPPFNSNANYNVLYGKDQKGKPLDERAQFIAFNDTWYWSIEAAERVNNIKNAVGHPAHKAIWGLSEMLPESGMLAYLSYMAERLAVIYSLLKDTGSIYLHCDPTASHYLKMIMDCVFGGKNFRNEIVWCYTGPSVSKNNFPAKSDTIFRYTKSNAWTFHADAIRIPYKALHGKKSTTIVGGELTPEAIAEYKKKGKVPENWWADISPVGRIQSERTGYPTQKPLALLDRIIRSSSNKGDLVFDPFCGCGTTIEAAWKLGRKFLGIDISPYAITRVCKDRMKRAGGVSVMGLPTDMRSARALCAADPFAFEHWAISLLEGYAPNDKQVADGGIDGRGRLLNPPLDESGKPEKGLCVAQVKGGKPGADTLRAFLSQIAGGAFSMGVFVTLEKPRETPTMREVATKAGAFQSPGGAKTYNRIVFWSIEEYFDGIEAKLPDMTHPFTGKALHPEIPAD
ncbi:MAG: DNA methyltransferase [Gammaproteobacteria bacterium]|nr:DNA methyltransferase [Gammaproteobacteria bacterium]